MNQLNRNELILAELEKTELLEINGGKVAYTSAGDSIFSTLYNAAVSIRNWWGD